MDGLMALFSQDLNVRTLTSIDAAKSILFLPLSSWMRTILAAIVSITFYFDRFVLQKRQISAVLEKYRQFSAALFANILPFAYLCSVFFDKNESISIK
jgi:hypothetical protein